MTSYRLAVLLSGLMLCCTITIFAQDVPVTVVDVAEKPQTISEWLIAGPVPSPIIPDGPVYGAHRMGYLIDFLSEIGGEGGAQIKAGTTFHTPEGAAVSFSRYEWQERYLDLTEVYGKLAGVCAYLYMELNSPKEQEVYIHTGSNDAAKLWINGRLIMQHPGDRSASRSQNTDRIVLPAGRTTVLFKIDQAGGNWGGYFEIYDPAAHDEYIKKSRRKPRTIPDDAGIARILETKVICKQPGRYIGWPSITRTDGGELLAVFSGERDGHVCPFGVTQMIRSQDNGRTWSEPVIINNTPLDDRDAGIIQTSQGTLLVTWFTSLAFDDSSYYSVHPGWQRHAEKLGPETREFWLGNWTRRSEDNGQSWLPPVKHIVTAPHGAIQLRDGRLLYVGIAGYNDEKKIGVEVSSDDGRSWQYLSTIEIPEDESMDVYWEPHVTELHDGRLLALFRYQEKDDQSQHFFTAIGKPGWWENLEYGCGNTHVGLSTASDRSG